MKSRSRSQRAFVLLGFFIASNFGYGPKAVASSHRGTQWIRHGAKHVVSFTAESARFYSAVAVVTYWDCVQSHDPARCQAFLKSLEDPQTYAGFGLFVMAARTTGLATYRLTGGHYSGNYLGMAAGLLVSELYGEFRAHPKTQELLATTDPKTRAQAMHALWEDTLADPTWWNEKVPSILTLFAGAKITSLAIPTLIKAFRGSEFLIDLSNARQATMFADSTTLLARLGRGLRTARGSMEAYQAAARGLKGVARVNPYLWITAQIGELVLFTKFSDWVEIPARSMWYRHQFSSALRDKLEELEALEHQASPPSQALVSAVSEVEHAWEKLRSVDTLRPKSIQALYLNELNQIDQQLLLPYFYYKWIAGGMKADDPIIRENPFSWKPGDKSEIQEYVRSFFCGPLPEHSVQPANLIFDMPVPGKSEDRIIPYRVTTVEGFENHGANAICELRVPIGDDNISSKHHDRRLHLLNRHNYLSDTEHAQDRAVQAAQKLREDLIGRYQKSLRHALLRALGKPDAVESSTVLDSLAQEEHYWKAWNARLGNKTPIFRESLDHIQQKREVILQLISYLNTNTQTQKSLEEDLFDDAPPASSTESAIKSWKKFMLLAED